MEEAISNVGYLTTDDDINRMAAIQLENSQVHNSKRDNLMLVMHTHNNCNNSIKPHCHQ